MPKTMIIVLMLDLSIFAERLSECMAERNLNPPALARILNTDRTNITRYLRGERVPMFRGFINILEFFDVSADYLLGKSDFAEGPFLASVNFGERFRYVLEFTATSQYRIVKDLRISGDLLYKWLHDQSLPSIESLAKMADYLDISVDFLLGRVR